MKYARYIARRRARFTGLSGQVNIPYGTVLENRGGTLILNGEAVCRAASQNACDYFSQDDDGRGSERGALTGAILSRLEKRDHNHQARWDRVWESQLCQRYRRQELEDYWLWSQDFYEAPVEDLRQIAALVGAK